jgi:hypothetical protein
MTIKKAEDFFNRHQDEQDLNDALHLIKVHITETETAQNRDLHQAVQLIVTVARRYDLLGA